MTAAPAPAPTATRRTFAGMCSRAITQARQSAVSERADPSSQPRTGFPRSNAITVPSPSATSRAPSIRANRGAIGSEAFRPAITPAARPGAITAARPIAIRERARDMASVVLCIVAIVSVPTTESLRRAGTPFRSNFLAIVGALSYPGLPKQEISSMLITTATTYSLRLSTAPGAPVHSRSRMSGGAQNGKTNALARRLLR
jgi:hypothetical protein